MAHPSSIFSRMPIELPNRSGFNLSHENMGTGTTGTLYPVLVDELLPNDTVSLGANLQVQLPPMATDFYGKVDYVLEAFFVPCRLLWKGWESFMTHPTAGAQYPSSTPVLGKSKYLPQLEIPEAYNEDIFSVALGPGTLADYLGMRGPASNSDIGEVSYSVNMLPFLAYHRIWDDWYRDSRIQAPLFYAPDDTLDIDMIRYGVAFKPNYAGGVNSADVTIVNTNYSGDYPWMFYDQTPIYSLRQRNFAKDYFTSASYLPQAGNAATLTFEVDGDDTGTFSISALRAANSLQKWMERNNIAGYRYSDQIYAQYGIYPSDAIMDKCIYLGRHVENVYTRSVFQTSRAGESAGNPYNSIGAKFGSSQVLGSGSLVDNIRVTEHGYLFVLASLVPRANYSSGTRRYLNRKVVGDIAFPLLSGMGDQAIMKSELDGIWGAFSDVKGEFFDEVFGYTDLYAEYKYHDDEVHGHLQDGADLSSFALQRSFSTSPGTEFGPELGSEFLQIPITFMDQVFASSTLVSKFSHWYDIYFTYKKISTLPEYSLPTLADLKNVHTKYISRGGKRL